MNYETSLKDIKDLKNNIYYLREGLSFYIDYFIKNNEKQLEVMYQILQRQELILTCNETGNEKKFAASLLTKDLIFKRLSFSNLNLSDFDLIKDVFYNSISIETLDSLKSNEKIKSRTIKSFSDYKKNTKENIISMFHNC